MLAFFFRFGLIITLVLSLLSPAFAGDRYMPTGISPHLNVAQMGMGGLTTVVGTNAQTLFYNPALLNRQKFAIEAPAVSVGINNDVLDVIEFIDSHQEEFDRFDSLTIDEQRRFINDSQAFDNRWMGIQASQFTGFSAKGFGAGMYHVTYADIKLDQGVFVPAVGFRGFFDFVVGGGIGRKITIKDRPLELGLALRYVRRNRIAPIRISAVEANDFESVLEKSVTEFEDSQTGFGIDLGAVFSRKTEFRGRNYDIDYAVVVQDFIGVLDGYLKPRVSMGAMIHMPFGGGGRLLRRWDIGGEVTDFFNREGVHFFRRINIGTEINSLIGFLKLRAGFHQGYPTAGIGIKLLIVSFDYAYFTRELGTKPGLFPESTHQFQLTLGF